MAKNKINLKKRHNAIILLSILLDGYPIRKKDKIYWLSEDYYLCQEAISENTDTGKKKKILLKIGFGSFGLKNFIDWANTFTFNEITINSANSVLNDLRRGD